MSESLPVPAPVPVPVPDIRDELGVEHQEHAHSLPPVEADAHLEIRPMVPDDAALLAHCFFHCYGPSYELDWAYRPDEIRARMESGEMVSFVAVREDGRIMGHLGLDFDPPGSRVADSAHAVVDPRYRGHHVFESLKSFAAAWASEQGLYGLFSDATAAHPYSQKGNLALGAHEMGILLGSIRSGVDYAAIKQAGASHRIATALFYLRTNPEPPRTSYAPAPYVDLIAKVYANSSMNRVVDTGGKADVAASSQIDEQALPFDNETVLAVRRLGHDVAERVAAEMAVQRERGIEVVYLDVPLCDPGVGTDLLDEVLAQGFFFGCVIPELHHEGDVLRLQFLNGVDPHIEDVHTASTFGQELLAAISALVPAR